ncbi:hypothetical protein INT45_002542 [Circinella minor]|uniref:Shugoshin C-terminal domain-containing protein n=1 Tax=Circinella minor TaxID=1195481 RepID=A0A8H7RXF3_9FUNG|nr:hypothetical protein INT45_002542 [Circinella minor]
METNFSIEKYELLKKAHLKQNRELIRSNTNYASRIHKLEDCVSTLKSENLKLRTRLIHVERQLKLKEERLEKILQQLFSEEDEVVVKGSDDSMNPVTPIMLVKEHQLQDIKLSSDKRGNEEAKQKQYLPRELYIMSTMNEDDSLDDKSLFKKKRVDSTVALTTPSSSKSAVEISKNNMSIISNSDNKENGFVAHSHEQLLPMEEEYDHDNSTVCSVTTTEEEQIESLECSDDDMLGYSVEPPLSPGFDLLFKGQQYKEKDEQVAQQQQLTFADNKQKLVEMSDSNNIDINVSKEEEAVEQKSQKGRSMIKRDGKSQQRSEKNWNNNKSITTTSNTSTTTTTNITLCGNKRVRTPKNYTLPSVKKKLRQGDPFTFDYQNTSTLS